MNKVFGIIVLSLLLSSCGIFKKNQTGVFDTAQLELINAGNKDQPMRLFVISQHRDSILLRKNSEIVELPVEDENLDLFEARLLTTMIDTANQGVGIAAPQVGILKRMIWVQRFDKEGFPYEVYYNPKIIEYSIDKQDCKEGCLSIPNKTGVTKTRSYSIVLKHQLKSGEFVTETIEGFTAVIFQHEIDHLNGILFIDHLESES